MSRTAIYFIFMTSLASGFFSVVHGTQLQGRVFQGSVGDVSSPLEGVTVKLYASNDIGVLGKEIDSTSTDSNGWYGLDTLDGYEYFNIVQENLASYVSVDATSINGSVIGPDQIRYATPLDTKVLLGNKFWDIQPEEVHPIPANNAPVAMAGGPYSGVIGEAINLDGSNSYDPDGQPLMKYEWDLDGDDQYDDATGKTLTWSWDKEISLTIGLKVTDPQGVSDTDKTTCDVKGEGYDYGDAPVVYPVLEAHNGASHSIASHTFCLGDLVDGEENGQPDGDALGDDNDGEDDEDGVTFASDLILGEQATVSITVNAPNNADFKLMGWIDYDGDGQWLGCSERIIYYANTTTSPGQHTITNVFQVPFDAQVGITFARFRLFYADDPQLNFNVTGASGYGEVEDYRIEIKSKSIIVPELGKIQGFKWNDLDGDGQWDTFEPPLANWVIGLDDDEIEEPTDLYATTDANGMFQFSNLVDDTYIVWEVPQSDWKQTWPPGNNNVSGTYTVAVVGGEQSEEILFGNQQVGVKMFDWGDAPDPTYSTLQANNGAVHMIVPGIHLGTSADGESDGQPSAHAIGDDNDGSDDEDGVVISTPWVPGQSTQIQVTASVAGMLDAWVDFGGDGNWTQPSDRIFTAQTLTAGSNMLTFTIPSTAKQGINTFARFRFSSAGDLTYDGPAQDGEVEDYMVWIGEGESPEPIEPNDPGESTVMPIHLKWSQPPIEIDPNLAPHITPVFCGWDEPAVSTQTGDSIRQWLVPMDDFRCLGSMPVTAIRWWGSYNDWDGIQTPDVLPTWWQISIWTSRLDEAAMDAVVPDRLVWQMEITSERVCVMWVGKDRFPEKSMDTCFQYALTLKPSEFFWQHRHETQEDIFWISIVAMYSEDTEPDYTWGWKTRPYVWNNPTLLYTLQGEGPHAGLVLDPETATPVNAPLCGQSHHYDMSFELFTWDPWIKWDQAYTDLHAWPYYQDEQSMAVAPGDEPAFILREVADDWICENAQSMVALSWWGSYVRYGIEPCSCAEVLRPQRPDAFLLTLYNNTSGNQPGDKVWEYQAEDYDEVLVGYDRQPSMEPNEPAFRYTVRLPEDQWFTQSGDHQRYWFSIVAVFEAAPKDLPYLWGWTTHRTVFGSGAVVQDFLPGGQSDWQSLPNPLGESMDMSFQVFTQPGQASGGALQPLAHWPFDEDTGTVAHDHVGGHDGTVHGGVWTDGWIEGALQMNGLNDYIDMGESPQLSPDEMTLGLWFCPHHMGGLRYIVGRAHTDDLTDYAILWHTAGRVEFVFDERGSGLGSVTSTTQLALDEWAHVAVTRDSNEAGVYINGQNEGTKPCGNRSTGEGFQMTISSRRGQIRFFHGKIDDVRLYDTALTPEQISGILE